MKTFCKFFVCLIVLSCTLTAEIPVTTGSDESLRKGSDESLRKMYWTDNNTNKIQRANLDGSNVEDLVTNGLEEPSGIALDVEGGKMYWIDVRANKIQRANLDGSNVEDIVTIGLEEPSGIALDVVGGKMYWTDVRANKIRRANLDGSNVEDIVIPGLIRPLAIALDVEGGKMYWAGTDNSTDKIADKIQRANLDGSNVEDLITQGYMRPLAIALDVEGGKMYWTDSRSSVKIRCANLDGSNMEDLVIQGLKRPTGIALDVEGGKMYWTDFYTEKIQRANLDGSNVEDIVTLELLFTAGLGLEGLGEPLGIALDVVGGKMYWTDNDPAKIQRANLDGSNVEDLITHGLLVPRAIALDVVGEKMYWTDFETHRIRRANLDGSDVEDIVTQGLRYPRGIALDVEGGKMYWIDNGTDKIQRANLDGTDVEDLITQGLRIPSGIALDVVGGKMYWTDVRGTVKIQRANLDGSNVEDLVTTSTSRLVNPVNPLAIALDVEGGKMYWTDSVRKKIQRANLDGTDVEDLVTQGLKRPFGIALDVEGGKMYWTDAYALSKIQRANLDGTDVEDLVTQGLKYPYGIAIANITPVNPTTGKVDVNRDGLVVESVQANHIKSFKEISTSGHGPGSVIHDRYTGQDFEIHATVKNHGHQKSTAAVLKYYRSVDDTISPDMKDDILLDASAIKPLPVGDSAKVSVRVTAPETPGVYYYGVCLVDSVGEGNCLVVKITVRGTEPDLVIESISAEPSNVLPGSQFKLHVSYRNQGAVTSAETAVKYYRSANETFSDTDKLTATGERVPVTGKSTISRERTETAPENPGTYYYGACVESVPNESNIENNCSDAVPVTVSGIGLNISEGLISDVTFTPNHTFFVLHPQFLPATNNSLDDYLLHRSTITLHLGGLFLDDTADYYTLPLPIKDNKSITEQVEDIGESTGKMLVQYMIGKIPLGEDFKFGDLLKIGKIFFSFGDISDPNEDPKAELVYYANKHFGNTTGGDTYPILYVIKDKRLSSVGFEVEQVYHPPGSWIDIDLDFSSETSPSDTFSWLPSLFRIPAVFVSSIAVGAADLVFGTIEEVIEGFNSLLVDINNVRYEPTTVRYEGVWNLEETFQMEHSGLAAPSANLMSLADYPLFQQLPPEVQVDLFQFLEARDFGSTAATEILRIPEESSLLPNYPNPFNPETWIPYQLAKPADVSITIYAADGKLVRKLNLGHQPVGIYQGKSRAAHWNGKNAQGEPVASGIYFYTLSAGEYTATRRMLILK